MTEEVVVSIKGAVGLSQVENCRSIPLRIEDLADIVEAVENVEDLQLDEVSVCPRNWKRLHR